MASSSPFLHNSDVALTQLASGSFTASFWLKPAATSIDSSDLAQATLLLAPAWKVVMNADGTLTFTIKDSVSSVETGVTSASVVADWNFVAVRYDLGLKTLTIDLNGTRVETAFSDAADSSLSSYTTAFQVGDAARLDIGPSASAQFDADNITVWARALTDVELATLYGSGAGDEFPFWGGSFNMLYQGVLINDPQKPLVGATDKGLWSFTQSYDSTSEEFAAVIDQIYSGSAISQGYSWAADNFYDKLIFAQHDNRAQYWTPPLPRVAQDLPGLSLNDAVWDGVACFSGHVLLWEGDRLKWSDKDDFTNYIPIASTANSAVLSLNESFVQPPAGGQVTVNVTNQAGGAGSVGAGVGSISLSGSLSFPGTAVGATSSLLLTLVNTGTVVINVTGISLPAGYSGNFIGAIPVNESRSAVITFAPTAAQSYGGAVTVASDATSGTTSLPVSGAGTGSTKVLSLSGVLNFGSCKDGHTLVSALVLENQGTATLTVTGLTFPAGFTGAFAGTIAAGAKHIVPVTFTPTAVLAYAGNIVVASDKTDGENAIAVSGTGISGFVNLATFVTDNGSCDFGKVASGGTATGTLRIYNPTGLGSLKVGGITLPAGFSGAFTGTIPAFSFHDVVITFSPVAAADYGGLLAVVFTNTARVDGQNTVAISGTGTVTGKVISMPSDIEFGDCPIGGRTQGMLKIKNVGTVALAVSGITYPGGFAGAFVGSIAPGDTQDVIVTFAPTAVSTYTGTVTVASDATAGTGTLTFNGNGIATIGSDLTSALVADQTVSLEDVRGGVTYYNFYTVVSLTAKSLVLTLNSFTGATPPGLTMPADGRQFFTLDANEAGETRIVGAKMNGPIFRILPQGDYAYCFKERSVQSIQYTGLGNGTFFVHNEVSGEGLIARDALLDRFDGTMVFLGHRELYAYQGGPNPVPVCQQATRQLYKELDRTRLHAIRLFHNENRKEVWVKYPVAGGFRVLIWNYIEDSATFDDYDASVEFTALGLVDWISDIAWDQFADATTWATVDAYKAWQDWVNASADHIPLIACADGNLRAHGLSYSRDGAGYTALSETQDFDLGEPDIWKYVDVVVLGLDVKVPNDAPRYLSIQVGSQASLSGGAITWTAPQRVLVNGKAPVPVKVNPGGAGRYLRLRFISTDADVQWRVSSFEIHCRPGSTY